jgi:hypothetical protein
MHVTIHHREEIAGVSGNQRNYFVDCLVKFSEKELAIINARDLQGYSFSLPASTPLPTGTSLIGVGLVRVIGRFLIVGGFLFGMISGLARMHGEGLAMFMLVVGIGLAIWGRTTARSHEKRLENVDQIISVRDLISNGRFSVHALFPAEAKAIEGTIRESLSTLKLVIEESSEVPATQSFEI